MLSTSAAAQFADNSLAFVYLDANHYYEYVKQDLEAFYPKVMVGGMLAGHDFAQGFDYGVIRAVTEFAASRRLMFAITDPPLGGYREPICCSGWYLFKPAEEPPAQSPAGFDQAYCHAWWLNAAVPCSALSAGNHTLSGGTATGRRRRRHAYFHAGERTRQ